MKKMILVVAAVMAFTLVFTGVGFAAEPDYDTIVNWDIQIAVPEDTVGVMDGNNYYIYPQVTGSIPYVMVRAYEGFEDEYDFIYNYFTEYMGQQYSDLEVTESYSLVYVEGRIFYEIDYGYTVQGHPVTDRRMIKTIDDTTYMFASKEIEELDMTVGTLLQVVAAECIFLRDGEPIPESELGDQEGDIPEVRWEMAEPMLEEEGVTGSFVTFEEVGYEMFVPDILRVASLPAMQTGADTFIGFFLSEAEDAYASVQYVPSDITLEEFKEFVASVGAEDMEDFLVNDNLFVLYFLEGGDSMSLATHTGDGILEFTFAPLSDEYFSVIAEIMGASIRKTE